MLSFQIFYVCESFIGSEKHGEKTQNVQNVSLVAAGWAVIVIASLSVA